MLKLPLWSLFPLMIVVVVALLIHLLMDDVGEPEKDVDILDLLPSGVKLVDTPILFFVISHKAIVLELADIRRVAVEASNNGSQSVELVRDLSRRLELLKIVYKYHCAAEDENEFERKKQEILAAQSASIVKGG
ncbi:hypothetical protein P3L10_032921 [Capsicum annuum]|uniref:uncharacterized protein LOC124889788 n=1 Tax=Capsicum annuum TaxID=4072 RepID=UPI001FB0D8E6|nr:uncharacterized protein LOC124889788 [Capsicum annuum]